MLKRWEPRYPRLTDWAEEDVGAALTFYRLPPQHHKHQKSTHLLERLSEEIKRRARTVRIVRNETSCLWLVRADYLFAQLKGHVPQVLDLASNVLSTTK